MSPHLLPVDFLICVTEVTVKAHPKVVSSIDSGNCNATKINKIEMNLVT